MTAFPDLYAFVLQLHPSAGSNPRPQGHGAQALFLDLLRQVAPDVSEALHADALSKAYTVSILPRRQANIVELRVTLLQSGLFQPFVHAMLQQSPNSKPLRLGSASLHLGDVIGTPAPQGHDWAGYGSFAQVYQQAQAARTVTLEFASPTAIGQGERANRKQRLELLPNPHTVFNSIAKRWNSLAPSELALDPELLDLAIKDTLVTRYRVESTEISLGKGPQKGFVGICSYESPLEAEQARLIALLADAAFFLGVGMKTARGMGLCRRKVDPER
jgi:CRISPR-associated endoribonuclease Cas6